jgi:hypothetical protein
MVDSAANFLIPLWYPAGTLFVPLNLQPAYLPQYIACYLFGAARGSTSPAVLSKPKKIILLLIKITCGVSLPALRYTYL